MDDVSAELSVYLRRLNRLLDCPKPLRKSFLKQTKRIAEDFIRGKPDAVPQEITDYLGDPQELAQGFLETLDQKVLKRHCRKKKLLRWSAVVLAVVICLLLSLWIHLLHSQPLSMEFTETTTIYHYIEEET